MRRTLPAGNRLNSDLWPYPVKRDFLAWIAGLPGFISRAVQRAARLRIHHIALAAAAVGGILCAAALFFHNPALISVSGAAAFGGLGAGCLFAATMLAFQAVYGTLHFFLGPFIAATAMGGAVGMIAGRRGEDGYVRRIAAAACSYGCLAALALALPLLFGFVKAQTTLSQEAWHQYVTFPLLFGGFGFFVAAALPASAGLSLPRALVASWACGVGAGLLFGSLVVIPVLGVIGACEASAILSSAAALLVLLSHFDGRRHALPDGSKHP